MTEPQRVGAELAERTLATQAKVAHLHRAVPAALEPDDYDDVPGQTLHLRRNATWQRAIPGRFQWAALGDLADQPPEVVAALDDWASDPDGRNLLLLGPVGVGKTHAAVAAARGPHFERGTDVRFLPVVELLDLLRPGGPENALYDLADTDLLVLDDLGSERPTEWTAERLYALINRRWLEVRPTVCTTNLPATRRDAPEGYQGATLDEAVGERVFSRLVGNGAVVLRLTGHDRRRKVRRAD